MSTTLVRISPKRASLDRRADEWSVEYAFIGGVAALGCVSLGLGFVRQKILLFVLRGISGLCKYPNFFIYTQVT
jgi:hypothetical protein